MATGFGTTYVGYRPNVRVPRPAGLAAFRQARDELVARIQAIDPSTPIRRITGIKLEWDPVRGRVRPDIRMTVFVEG